MQNIFGRTSLAVMAGPLMSFCASMANAEELEPFAGAQLIQACLSSGAVDAMQEQDLYEFAHIETRIKNMQGRLAHQKTYLNEVGLAFCEKMYKIGKKQAQRGVWNEAAVSGALMALEIDADHFVRLQHMATYVSPSDIASDDLGGDDEPDFSQGILSRIELAYGIEALSSIVEFGAEAVQISPGNMLDMAALDETLRRFQAVEYGPGDSFARHDLGERRAISGIMKAGNHAEIDPDILDRELLILRGGLSATDNADEADLPTTDPLMDIMSKSCMNDDSCIDP